MIKENIETILTSTEGINNNIELHIGLKSSEQKAKKGECAMKVDIVNKKRWSLINWIRKRIGGSRFFFSLWGMGLCSYTSVLILHYGLKNGFDTEIIIALIGLLGTLIGLCFSYANFETRSKTQNENATEEDK